MTVASDKVRSSTASRECYLRLAGTLRESFDASFMIWDAHSGELLHRPEGALGDEFSLSAILRADDVRKEPQFVIDLGAVCFLAVPLTLDDDRTWVATAPFVVGRADDRELGEIAATLGMTACQLNEWLSGQMIWPAKALIKLAEALRDKLRAEGARQQTANEIELVSENLASTYEEISLLYAVTQNLKISSTDEELGKLAIERLGECLPAKSFAIMYLPTADSEDETYKSRSKPLYIASGEVPVDESEFLRLIDTLDLDVNAEPYVANLRVTEADGWQFPLVRQLIVVPMLEGKNVFGWIAAFNHCDDAQFGTVEANLIGSLGTLLGIHCGNRELYRQQSDLLANIIRALVSAIDAKDPYTSGHSDRVARFAVRLGLEMQCNPKFLHTIYMAGLLHDVGKIGIDDNVLRKAGHLTAIEFEHIKKHPELGYKILADLKPLSEVLPAVLHHHEQWDGAGYPYGLAGQEIPKIARILAVADAYDAMTSDRPYRRGMPEEKVVEIFRDGAGKYWDPEVIEAFFRAKDEIRLIAQRDRGQIDVFQQQFV